MNILILSWRGLGHPNTGGAEISTHEHAKAWVKYGHQVTLFTSHYSGAKKQEVIEDVNILREGNQIFGVHLAALKWYLLGKHPKYDLVIDQYHGIPFFTPLFVRVKKLAFIHEVAKEVWLMNEFSWPLNFIAASFGKIIEPQIFKLYRNIPFMTVSESTKEELVMWGIPKENITVIHNGVTVLGVSAKKENKKTLVFLGALAKDKGIETALLTFSHLQKRFKENIQFWIIGKGNPNYLRVLKNKAVKLGLKDVKFLGYVTDKKKFELLSKAHILINTSIREGWGLVVIEAAAVGTPTVAFNVPGLRDSIVEGETGLLIKGKTPQELSDKAAELLADKDRLSKMSRGAISWSKKFSWEKSTRQSMKLIENLMKGRNSERS